MRRVKWKEYNKQQIQVLINESHTKIEVLQKMGYTGNDYKAFNSILKEYPDLDLSSFNKRPYRRKNIIGQKFGHLTVLKFDEERSNNMGKTYVFAQCDCPLQTTISVRSADLISGNTLSCGCNRQSIPIGTKFHKLTVLEYDLEKCKEKHHSYVKVCCDCNPSLIYSIRADSLTGGKVISCGCEKCSHGEIKIEEILTDLNLNYIKEYSFQELKSKRNKLLRIDFYLPENNTAIEFQGKQHYVPVEHFGGQKHFDIQRENDQLKREYCKANNIQLIEIPYWDYDKIDENYLKNLLGM